MPAFSFPNARRSCAALALCLLCCGVGIAPSAAAPAQGTNSPAGADTKPLSLDQYRAELDRAIAEVHGATTASASHESTAPAISKVWIVETGGQRYQIPTNWLREALDTSDKDANLRRQRLEDAGARLALLRAETQDLEQSEANPNATNASNAQAHLAEILRRREFRRIEQQKSWIAELWERILVWLLRLLAKIFGSAERAGTVKNLILYGAIVAAFVLLAWTAVRALRTLARSEAALRLSGAPPAGKTWNQWAREALAAAGRGDYREAIHAAYWSGVYRLADLGVWQLDRSLTPREYLRLLRQPSKGMASRATAVTLADPETRARRADALGALTRSLEAVWYADRPATQEDFRVAVTQLESLGCQFPSNAQTANSSS